MLNDHIMHKLSAQHRQDIQRAAEGDRLLREVTADAAQTDVPSAPPGSTDGVSHRLHLFFRRAARQEMVAYRVALCRCILEQFRLGAISIDEAEHRLSQLM